MNPSVEGGLLLLRLFLAKLVFQLLDPLTAGLKARLEVLHLLLQGVNTRVHLQEDPHHRLRPPVVDRQRLFSRQHTPNSRRKSQTRG